MGGRPAAHPPTRLAGAVGVMEQRRRNAPRPPPDEIHHRK
ncbi:hypothetical protein HMPREF1979_00857 [Actinomyces johnsonii F0542]|uniref:Uncharacterized protein n=1 Tax=Actinomyces johnsonii F0542 TaxID=1321818 RepID=U1QSU2_9ACTO|nr:hypothetical protein HMPREF1979_00857 [Actinomyces johnsonii F0542]